ncbi:AAA family ATPase [Shewanella baltica]|uniref:ATP-binding protein n=1 Tax=Shewanella baltica TaxID=62322 RepID=UPI00217EDAF1|nr:ATP-binding protein [Shewanella baltica]MCS6234901.1 AAA family ATPase [Shewanella baltica]MCS6269427.1 AAA family ATPase [Shewanella baltica]
MVKAKIKKEKSKISRFNYQLKKLHISNLKGIKDFTLEFETDKRVTAVVGINGSGKSTLIHALACAFKPKGKQTSKDFNRLSHFSPQIKMLVGMAVNIVWNLIIKS